MRTLASLAILVTLGVALGVAAPACRRSEAAPIFSTQASTTPQKGIEP